MKDSTTTVNGCSFFMPALAILFIALKLTGVILWPWWAVLLPLYGGIALVAVGVGVFALFTWMFGRK